MAYAAGGGGGIGMGGAAGIYGMVGGLVGGAWGMSVASQGPNIPGRIMSNEIRSQVRNRARFADDVYRLNLQESVRNPYIQEQMLTASLLGSGGYYTSAGTGQDAVYVPRTRGLLNIMGQDILPRYDQMMLESAGRTMGPMNELSEQLRLGNRERELAANIDFMDVYGPDASAALRSAQDPELMALRDELLQQSMTELGYGPSLDPALQREYTQAVRAGQSARGMGVGPVDVYEEAFTLGSAGEARRAARQDRATQLLMQLRQTEPAAYNLIMGTQGLVPAQMQQVAQAGQLGMAYGAPTQMAQWDPMNPSPYVTDFYDWQANRGAAEALATFNAKLGILNNVMNS